YRHRHLPIFPITTLYRSESVAHVAQRDTTEDALVRATEVEGDVLADDEASVGVDHEAGDEAVDRKQPSRLRRGRARGRQHEGQRGDSADALSSRRRRAGPDGLRGDRARSTGAWRSGRTTRSDWTGSCRWSC